MEEEITGKAKGGKAAAALLTPEQRKERAKNAATARWTGNLPQASHEGEFPIGESLLLCANLPEGKRIITQATFLRALGRSRSPKAGTGVLSTVDELPFFLQAEVIKPFITEELAMSTKPIFYRTKKGGKGVGYDATLLPKVAEVYLKYRDMCYREKGEIPKRYEHIISASDVLMRGLAHVGIIALVDEATGYQEVRNRDELNKILEAYISAELLPWTRRFPNEFYKEMFRVYGWQYNPFSVKRTCYAGTLTNKLIYEKLPPGVLEELKKKNPRTEKGYRRHKYFQFLTEDIGNPHLEKQLAVVTMLLRISPSKNPKKFESTFEKAFPGPEGYQEPLFGEND